LPAKAKLSEPHVKKIRRRVRRGERIVNLAAEFAVSRKTVRRRLDALEQADAKRNGARPETGSAGRPRPSGASLLNSSPTSLCATHSAVRVPLFTVALAEPEAQEQRLKAQRRLRLQAAAEMRKLVERERRAASPPPVQGRGPTLGREMTYSEWLARPKSLTGRALTEARGLVRLQSPDGRRSMWHERTEVEALIDDGWQLA
jgi:hypothetical protein